MPATTRVIHHESHSHEADLGFEADLGLEATNSLSETPYVSSNPLRHLSRGVAWLSVVLPRIVPVELSEDQHHLRR